MKQPVLIIVKQLTLSPVDGDIRHRIVLTEVHLPPGGQVTAVTVDTVGVINFQTPILSACPAVHRHTGRICLAPYLTESAAHGGGLPIGYIHCTTPK